MKLIKRTYRIYDSQDKQAKRKAKKLKLSNSGYIRHLIDKDDKEVA